MFQVLGLRKRGTGPFSIRHGATVLLFLNLYPFFPFLSYCTVALTPPPHFHPHPPPTSIQCHCDALLAYKLTKQPTDSRGHISLKTTFKNSPIWIQLSWIHEQKVREVVDRGDVAEGGGHTFSSGSSLQNEGKKKTLLSGLLALMKLILALCMVLYLFISPSFLLPKLKSPNKDPSSHTPPKKGRGRYFKCFAKVQPNIRGLTIKKEKKKI